MGFWDMFGGSKTKKQGMLFTTSLEIEKTLFHIGTLNQGQRMLVKEIIMKFLGSGGVTEEEYRTQVLPELYKLEQTGKISSVDYQKLKELIYQ